MSLDYDLTGFLGAGSQLSWPVTTPPQAPAGSANALTGQRQQTTSTRHQGHALAASHTRTHPGITHTGHGAGHQPAHPKKQVVAHHRPTPFGEKAF